LACISFYIRVLQIHPIPICFTGPEIEAPYKLYNTHIKMLFKTRGGYGIFLLDNQQKAAGFYSDAYPYFGFITSASIIILSPVILLF
jgi:hypothetical protein